MTAFLLILKFYWLKIIAFLLSLRILLVKNDCIFVDTLILLVKNDSRGEIIIDWYLNLNNLVSKTFYPPYKTVLTKTVIFEAK